MNGWTDEANKAIQQNPSYFSWWYTVKSVGLGVAVAGLAYLVGRNQGAGRPALGGFDEDFEVDFKTLHDAAADRPTAVRKAKAAAKKFEEAAIRVGGGSHDRYDKMTCDQMNRVSQLLSRANVHFKSSMGNRVRDQLQYQMRRRPCSWPWDEKAGVLRGVGVNKRKRK